MKTEVPKNSRGTPMTYRYEVTEKWGKAAKNIKVGTIVVDTYHGKTKTWTIMDMTTGKVTGTFTGKLIGRLPGYG